MFFAEMLCRLIFGEQVNAWPPKEVEVQYSLYKAKRVNFTRTTGNYEGLWIVVRNVVPATH